MFVVIYYTKYNHVLQEKSAFSLKFCKQYN